MSSSKKIDNRLNKLFDEIKHTEEQGPPAESKPVKKVTPVSPSAPPKKRTPSNLLSPPISAPQRKTITIEPSPVGADGLIAIPFQAGENWSMIELEQSSQHRWNEDEQSLVRQVADQLGLALNNARLFEETRKSAQQMAAVAEIATRISTILELQPLMETAVHLTQERFGLYHAHIFMKQADNKTFSVKACGWKEGDVHAGTDDTRNIDIDAPVSIVARAARNKIAVIANDVHADPTWLANPLLPGVQSEMAIPIVSGEQVFGVLNVHSDEIDHFTDADLAIMTTLAAQMGSAIQNALLFEATQISEANFRNLIENAPEAIIVIDTTTGLFIDPNENAERLFGLSREELIKVRPVNMGPENQADGRSSIDVFQEKLDETLGGGSPVFEWLFKNAHGEVIPCEIHLSRLPGDRPRVRATVVDITDRKKAEEAIRQAEFKYRSIFENATMGIFQTTMDGHYVSANPTLAKIYGYNSAEELALTLNDIEHQLYVDPQRRKDFVKVMTEKGIVYQFESAVYRKDGNIIWIAENARAVEDSQGNFLYYEGTVEDITELKQAEEALVRQNEYLATAAEVSRLISSTLDLPTLFERTVSLIQSRFKYYHVAVFTVEETGFNAILGEATGAAGVEMKKNQHALPVGSKSIIGTVTATGETLVVNNTALESVHRPNPLLPDTRAEAGIPLKIGTRVIGAVDIQSEEVNAFHSEDISVLQTLADQIAVAIDNAHSYDLAQKAVTEMRELDRIKSQFLANMSHELRTPLNSIIGFSRVILKGIDGPVSDQQHQDLSAIYNSGQHLLGLINDILDLSKMDAGKMELATEEMNIGDTITSVMSTAIGLLKDKTVKLKQEIEPNLPTIRGDPMRIRQIMLNLISNAAKFTDEGSITVKAAPHKSPTGQLEVMVSVTDTGPGISAEDQAKLFRAFSQVDSSATRKTGGTGLGLSISQRLVDMHGGRIGIHSVVGKGSTFYFTIPQFVQPLIEPVAGQGKVILCIDDDQQVIGLYDRYLKPQGYQVIPVTTPITARETIKRLKPYAVTLDIMMPGMDGWSLLQELKADPETRDVPVIICSIVEEEGKGFSLGASGYLVKPILEDDLLSALNRLNGDGTLKEVLIIDDSPDDLRLMEKMIAENSQFHPVLAEGGEKGWESIINRPPDVIVLDLFMPHLNGFTIIERLNTSSELRDIPVIVVSGADLTPEQKKQLQNLGKNLLQKGMLNEKDLFASLGKALKRLESR